MKLFEILDKIVPFKITEKTNDYFQTEAKINGRTIRFEASCEDLEEDEWDVAFSEVRTQLNSNGKHQISISINKTGSRGELEVFSMVRDSIKKFVNLYDPALIVFTAFKDKTQKNPEKRGDLYMHLVKKFGNQIPGYKLEARDDHTVFDKFILVRK